MFRHTHERACHNFQSHLFICFGPLLSGRHCIKHFIVSKSRQNRPKDNLDLIQKATLPCLNFIGNCACEEATWEKGRTASALLSTLATERLSVWKLCSVSTTKDRKAAWKTHLRDSRKEVLIWLSSEERLKTDRWVTRTTSSLLVVLLEGQILPMSNSIIHLHTLHYKFRSQTENLTRLLYPRLNLGRLLTHFSIQLLWLIHSVPDSVFLGCSRPRHGMCLAWFQDCYSKSDPPLYLSPVRIMVFVAR